MRHRLGAGVIGSVDAGLRDDDDIVEFAAVQGTVDGMEDGGWRDDACDRENVVDFRVGGIPEAGGLSATCWSSTTTTTTTTTMLDIRTL